MTVGLRVVRPAQSPSLQRWAAVPIGDPVEPVWVMWGGLAVAFVGFMAACTDRSFGLLHYFHQELFETIGRWVMRVGFTVAVVGAAAHLLAD